MPPTLVVGIGYAFDTPEDQAQPGLLRVRDFTPCSDALFEAQYSGGEDVCGGAAAFLDFIEHEVKPFVASRFPVDAADHTLVGSSLAGLFTLYTLFTAPQTFRRYVAISPALYWGGENVFELEEAFAARATDLPAHLFLAAGGLEEAHDAQQRFVSNVYRLDAKLQARAYPGLRLGLRIFDGETHMAVYFGAVARGLGAVFGGYRDMHDWSRWLTRA
jgi:predicted alpha/beta superfamily hydrolase